MSHQILRLMADKVDLEARLTLSRGYSHLGLKMSETKVRVA